MHTYPAQAWPPAHPGPAPSRTRTARRVVQVGGLVVSGSAAVATVVVALGSGPGEPGRFVLDLVAQGWTVLLLLAVAAPVRTLGWQPLLAVGLAGFVGLPAMARALGSPVVEARGVDDVVATSVWVPVTEEVVKVLPVLLVAALALRVRTGRPAALDLTLLGAVSGAGFALYENLQFGRATADPTAVPPLSLLVPSLDPVAAGYVAGHQVWSALLAAGLGFGLLYRRRFRLAWTAIPVTFAVVVLEHGVLNASAPDGFLLALVAHGLLSPALLLLAVAALAVLERRPTTRPPDRLAGVRLRPWTVQAQRASLAHRQRTGGPAGPRPHR